MKRFLPLAVLALCAGLFVSCNKQQPPPVHVHHYHNTTTTKRTTTKPAGVDRSNTPEGFQAVTPPATYSR